jgi:hypothetical protein
MVWVLNYLPSKKRLVVDEVNSIKSFQGCSKPTMASHSAHACALQTLRVIRVDHSARVWAHTRRCASPAQPTTLAPLRNGTASCTSGAITRRGGATPREFALNEGQSLISVFRSVTLMGCRVAAIATIRI